LLGQGAFGAVYQATKIGTNLEYAVKMIDVCQSPLEQIKQEADLLAAMEHPNVVRIYNVYYEEVFVCIVMDIHKGGELIGRMQKFWADTGRIPVAEASHIAFQLAAPVAHLHNKGVVHRDVKVDNYLTSPEELLDRKCKVYLADFGTALYLKPTERLSELCGTKLYWPPEFHKRDYSFKVDLWAIGVCYYGLCEGRFPFADGKEVFRKTLKAPTGVPPEISRAVLGLLDKSEQNRLSANQLMEEAWVQAGKKVVEGVDGKKMAITKTNGTEAWTPEGPVMQESGANAAVRNMRHELVDRMEHQALLKRGGTRRLAAGEAVDCWKPSFVIKDRHTGRSLKAEWWNEKKLMQSKVMPPNTIAATRSTGSMAASQVEAVKDMLEGYGINTKRFGVGGARTMQQFAEEVEDGSARLMLDARKTKALVRVVDTCLLRLSFGEGDSASYAIETLQRYEDGRTQSFARLPGTKKAPYESTMGAINRLITDVLGMDASCMVAVDYDNPEFHEDEEASPSFPGVRTVYKKEVVAGRLLTKDPNVLSKFGIQGSSAVSGWKWKEEVQRTDHVFKWMTTKQCASRGAKLSLSTDGAKISWLVGAQARVNVDEDLLEQKLQAVGVDTSQFGQVQTRSIADLARELSQGESSLMSKEGRLLRVCDVVLMQLVKAETGEVLIETEEEFSNGSKKTLNRLPGVTKQAEENEFIALKRVLKYLKIDENMVEIDGSAVHMVDDEKSSPSYPGLRTLYRKRVISATLRKAP